jgi:hypothetical protein
MHKDKPDDISSLIRFEGGAMESPQQDLNSLHDTYCTWYNNIVERRYTMLKLVPASTVISLVVPMFSDPTKNQALLNLVLPFGLAGALFIIGLFFVMSVSLEDGEKVLARIHDLEDRLMLQGKAWVHLREEHAVNRMATGFIFSIALAGWICVAFWFVIPGFAIYLALAVGVVSSALSIPFLQSKVVQSSV